MYLVLEPGTLMVLNILISLISAVAFLAVALRRPHATRSGGMLLWCFANLAIAAGFFALLLPAFVSFRVPALPGNLLIDAGTLLNFLAIMRYLARPRRDLWVLTPAGLLVLVEIGYVLADYENMRVMVALGGSLRGLLTIAAARALWTCADESRRSVARIAAAAHGLWAAVLVARMLWWLVHPDASALEDPTTGFGLIARILLTATITPCILWMLSRELDAQLFHYATHDGLTGLWNRRVLWERGERRAEQVRALGGSLAVLMIDVDHFKRINDQHGHAAGDLVLIAVAREIGRVTVADDFVGRIGGEEFLILPGDPDAALGLAERVRAAVARLEVVDVPGNAPIRCTVSIGHAEQRDAALAWERIVGAADQALYAAKREGRNRVRSATAEPAVEPPLPPMTAARGSRLPETLRPAL
ncbi:GGDEF domain-containing protein [Sphingomonas azotifigens]|uniref:GGDEF domain-containing protein n=1 Tax=Sphingomonas azotifigens TaxID=330920 RepID=UPI001C3F844D|nr:GGDEF domain-containing protein [Sphingomonas azotifigens]